MRISVLGCGYVGLVTGACLAEAGHHVVCMDTNTARIEMLCSGNLPFYEPHLDTIVANRRRAGNLAFTSNPAEAIRSGDVVFICVGTPPAENGEADLSAIDGVARTIATHTENSKLVVEKSTVPVQTGQQLKRALAAYSRGRRVAFRVASNPEFLREGTAVADFLHPDRIVVGVEDEFTAEQLRTLYKPLLEGRFHCPVHASACPPTKPPAFLVTTVNSAELIKQAANSFLALKISYTNLVADLCESFGANVEEVTRAMGMDPRIGGRFLQAGLGFGGFCLPKDLQAFIRISERAGVDAGLLKEVENVNKTRIDQFIEKVRKALWVIANKQVGLLGLAFKANTDDIRLAPSVEVIRKLLGEGAHVRAYDPEAMENMRGIFPGVHYCSNAYEVARGADALLILTEWDEFRSLDWSRLEGLMARPLIIDGRNILDPMAIRAHGFEYDSFGRPGSSGSAYSVHGAGKKAHLVGSAPSNGNSEEGREAVLATSDEAELLQKAK